MQPRQPKLIEVYRAQNVPEAYMLRSALEEAGVEGFIDGELLQGAAGELALGWSTAPRIMVSEIQADAAREVIKNVATRKELTERVTQADSSDSLHCLACGQPMQEFETRCSNCGWSYGNSQPGP